MTPKLAISLSSSICKTLDQALKQELSLGNERGGAEETQVAVPSEATFPGVDLSTSCSVWMAGRNFRGSHVQAVSHSSWLAP